MIWLDYEADKVRGDYNQTVWLWLLTGIEIPRKQNWTLEMGGISRSSGFNPKHIIQGLSEAGLELKLNNKKKKAGQKTFFTS